MNGQAAAGAGDDRDLAVEAEVSHGLLPFCVRMIRLAASANGVEHRGSPGHPSTFDVARGDRVLFGPVEKGKP